MCLFLKDEYVFIVSQCDTNSKWNQIQTQALYCSYYVSAQEDTIYTY